MIAKIFWALMILDTVALGILAYLASRGPRSPEGPVGGWLMFIPPLVMIVIGALVLITGSNAVKMAGVYILGFPWIAVIAGPIVSAVQHYQVERSLAGDDDFRGPQRKLAHAIQARDVALAKSFLPLAGDLSKRHGDDTLLHFALVNAPDRTIFGSPVPAASVEIVAALLAAGAKADEADAYKRWPLSAAISGGAELTELLLKAGANPNHVDDAGRPIWWGVLSDETDRGLRTLRVLLDHGADLAMRDREGGPAAWAAYHARSMPLSNWNLVWMLVERGAAWQGEQEFGQPVERMLAMDIQDRKGQGGTVSEAMRNLEAR